MQTTEAGIKTRLAGDVYLTIGDFNPEKGWIVRAWTRPFTVWMWIGAGVMAIGGVIGAFGGAFGGARSQRSASPTMISAHGAAP